MSKQRFVVFCQEKGRQGTIHIAPVWAADVEEAIVYGKQRCIDDWSAGLSKDNPDYDMETIHCLGVAAGEVDILHWEDQFD